jgi:hypothetical protein
MFCVPAEIQPKDKELDPPLLYWILNCTSAKYFNSSCVLFILKIW